MKDTWASGAIELINHADSHIKLNSAFDKRIAFISIDNSIEIAIRTFISLPFSKSQIKFSRKDIEDSRNSFPAVVNLIFKHAPQKVVGLEPDDIEHYHRIRNRLYHDGTGLSVDDGYLNAYRQIASVLLANLFGITLEAPEKTSSLERLIVLWNNINLRIRKLFSDNKIDYVQTYKWEEAQRAGILRMPTVHKLTELRMIRNQLVHSVTDHLDQEKIRYAILLAEDILRTLENKEK